MKAISYKTFSFKMHHKRYSNRGPAVCQFELTFRCGIHCRHCYSDCYNKPGYVKKELSTGQVINILDKVHNAGVMWLCLSGGDPLERDDFIDIYSYAKKKGFLVSIFTNAVSMNKRICGYLIKNPPFAVEVTVNAADESLYEKISQTKGSFVKMKRGVDMMIEAGMPLKIKTQVTQDNIKELDQIKKFVDRLWLNFLPNASLHARLDGDLTPCSLRISPDNIRYGHAEALSGSSCQELNGRYDAKKVPLFGCAVVSGDGIYIDPYGNLIPCDCIREPKVNLLRESLDNARAQSLDWVRRMDKLGCGPRCAACSSRLFCYNCPGKALLEKDSLSEVIDWYCRAARSGCAAI